MKHIQLWKVLIILLIFHSCNGKKNRTDNIDEPGGQVIAVSKSETGVALSNINFYLENSGSMIPYSNGSTDFNRAINTLLHDIDLLRLDSIRLYAANTEIHPLDQNLEEFISSFHRKGIPTVGNTNNSDLHLIFEKLLDEYESGTISILVTDAIYSVNGSKEELLGDLEQKALRTRNHFYRTLNSKDFGTLCLKMDSNYDGKYYPAIGGQVQINQNRPYYIWLFGDGNLLKTFAENLNLYNLPGYSNYIYSVKNGHAPSADYSIVEHTFGNIGKFRKENRGYPVHTITDIKRSVHGASEGEFGFAVAVDFSNIPLPDNHINDIRNYNTTSDNYELYDIKKIDTHLRSQAVDYFNRVEASLNGAKFTHLLFLKSQNKPLETFKIELHNEVPDWITKTGTDDDTEIQGDTETTFGFDKLISGILSAYNEINEQSNILSITLTVK